MPTRVTRRKSQVNETLPTIEEVTAAAVEKFAADDRNRVIVAPRQEMRRSQLEAYATRYGKKDARGHRKVYFSQPQMVGGTLVRGFVRERRTTNYLDEEAAIDLATERGFLDAVTDVVTTRVLSQDKLYAAQQRGLITPEELRSLFVTSYSYSVKRI